MKISKNKYIKGYLLTILLLAVVRLIFSLGSEERGERSEVSMGNEERGVRSEISMGSEEASMGSEEISMESEEIGMGSENSLENEADEQSISPPPLPTPHTSLKSKPHRINSVASYRTCFPDTNATQMLGAKRWGVSPVRNREEAESRKRDLVYVGSSPYYFVDRLSNSIPYLVPEAAVLLNDIGRAFYDSLYVKGVPLNQLIVTSVLRTKDDVDRLRRRNGNATENSCHLYGTTFDICYNRYRPVTREVRNDTLKWVLSEVLRDMREQGRCYIKYEVKQGCFHMTVR